MVACGCLLKELLIRCYRDANLSVSNIYILISSFMFKLFFVLLYSLSLSTTRVESKNGKTVYINDSMRADIEAQIACMSNRPLRCLLMAFKDVFSVDVTGLLNNTLNFMDLESNLILVGVTGLVDPPRPDGKENVFGMDLSLTLMQRNSSARLIFSFFQFIRM